MDISAKDDSLTPVILLLKYVFSRWRENARLVSALVMGKGTSKDQQNPDVREAIFIGIAQSGFHGVRNGTLFQPVSFESKGVSAP